MKHFRKYIHQFFSVTFCLVFISSIIMTSFASAVSYTPDSLPGGASSIQEMFEEAVIAARNTPSTTNSPSTEDEVYLTTIENSDGDIYDIQMFEYLPGSYSEENTHTKTMVYSTSPEYITPRATHTQTNSGYDSSISVYGYLTITYDVQPFNDTSVDQYLLKSVSGGWDKSDDRVTMSNRYVSYTCQYILDVTQLDWVYPTTNTFSYNTGYTLYVPDDSTSSVVGAVSTVQLAHGSSSKWELVTRAYIVENDIGDIVFEI